jgi:WD repeat-containing protein 70
VLYSPETSLNGAKLLLNKLPPRKVTIEDMSDALAAPSILTPHALPMFRDGDGVDGRGTKRKQDKARMDPRKSRRPELPVTGPGRGGRVGASATQHVVQNLVRDTTRDQDVSPFFLSFALFLCGVGMVGPRSEIGCFIPLCSCSLTGDLGFEACY